MRLILALLCLCFFPLAALAQQPAPKETKEPPLAVKAPVPGPCQCCDPKQPCICFPGHCDCDCCPGGCATCRPQAKTPAVVVIGPVLPAVVCPACEVRQRPAIVIVWGRARHR